MTSNQKFYETKEFKKLFKEWDDKLKAEGLGLINRPEVILIDLKIYLYFKLCLIYLRSGLIQDRRDRFIFNLHLEGVTSVKISEALVDSEFKTITPDGVKRLIRRLLERVNLTNPLKYRKTSVFTYRVKGKSNFVKDYDR